MKKLLSTILSLVLVISLAACGKKANKTANEKLYMEKFSTEATIEETVIYDENNIKITANELTYTKNSAELSLTFENNTDKDLSFISGSVGYDINSINGYMADDGYLDCDIPAGQTLEDVMTFGFSSLKSYGITCIADIEIGFNICDENYAVNIYTGPSQIKTTASDSYDYSSNSYQKIINNGMFENEFNCTIDKFSDDIIYDSNGIQIVSVTTATNSSGEPTLMLEIANNSDKRIFFKINEVYLNEHLVYEPLWTSNSITPGKKFVEGISLVNLANKYGGNIEDLSELSDISFKFTIGETFNNEAASQEITIDLSGVKLPVDGN